MLHVLGIAGSPRRWGNTGVMLKSFLSGAESQGAMVKQLYVSNLKIGYCQHCDECLGTGHCIIDDDMSLVEEDLAWADIIVVAAPLHFCGVPAQMKTLIDRGQSKWAKKYVLKEAPLYPPKERSGYILAAGGRDKSNIFDCVKDEISSWFISHNIKFSGMETAYNLNAINEVKGRPETLERMFNLGKRAVNDAINKNSNF